MESKLFGEILKQCEAAAADSQGWREFPAKTTLTLYVSSGGVGLTVPSIEAITESNGHVHARTTKGELYVVARAEIFAAQVDGRAQGKSPRKAGFG